MIRRPPRSTLSPCTTPYRPPHLVSEPVQVKSHVPLLQTAVPPAGAEQVFPQVPQLLTSVLVLTQVLPHLVKPLLQVKSQAPELQNGVPLAGALVQVLLHAPQ